MTRRQNASNKRRGAKEYFTGAKKEFLEEQGKLAYQTALDTKKQSLFYDKITVNYIATFGHLSMTPSNDNATEGTQSEEHIAEQTAENAVKMYQAL